MCSPHCWQYAKPTGVGVPQRGHVIMLPCAGGLGIAADGDTTTFGDEPPIGAIAGGGTTPGAVDGITPGGGIGLFCGAIVGAIPAAIAGASIGAPDGDIIGAPPMAPSAPPVGGGIGVPPPIGIAPALWPSALPHARQNFIPGGFSPRQTPQITGNPVGCATVWA
jgi:hypothetical protein